MTLQEFKAWFEGFSEGISDKPTAKQWERICARVADINGTTQVPYFVAPRYVPLPFYQERWPTAVPQPTYLPNIICGTASGTSVGMMWNDAGKHEFEQTGRI